MNKALGLYFHIPFCRSKCTYCDFYSFAAKPDVQAEYAVALAQVADTLRPRAQGYTVDTVYFGGGTPSVLAPEAFASVMDAAKRSAIAEGAEITTEANPAPLDPNLLPFWRKMGVNRLSFGMQSAIDEELRIIGRRHRAEDLAVAVGAAKSCGIDNISLDLMLGLPGQTAESVAASLSAALALAPTHLSVYCLKLEEGTTLARMVESGRVSLPDDEAVAEWYLTTAETLVREGFEHYEISNFALPGYRSRHNMRYWQRAEYLGFGPAAHSFFAEERRYFAADIQAFVQNAHMGTLDWILDDPADPIEETLILSLRTADGLDLAALATLTGEQTAAQIGQDLARLIPGGHVRQTAAGYALTAQGMLVSNTILSDLLLRL